MFKTVLAMMTGLCITLSGLFAPAMAQEKTVSSRKTTEMACAADTPTIIESSVTEEGNLLATYEDGIEVEQVSNKEWLIRDYNNVFEADLDPVQTRAVEWLIIGKAILKFVNYALATCQAIQYFTGHDICRSIVAYILNPPRSGTHTYTMSGRYKAGYIPGCEPRNSLPCNSGYWEYRVVKG
jgi:hypothetical protein